MDYNENVSDIQEEILSQMPDTYTKLKGTWLWEMSKAFSLKIRDSLAYLTEVANKFDITKLQGDELDAYVSQWTDITRKTAKKASGTIRVTGNGMLYKGSIVSNGIMNYETLEDIDVVGSADVNISAVEVGVIGNTDVGTVTTMVTSNTNIDSITNLKAIDGGTDEETDDSLRERYYLRLSMPATSGNKAHYILWARECAGVGGAKVTRDTAIKNKVNIYICSDSRGVADINIIANVQNYIDPNKNGDGSGVAPIGAICEVFSAGIKSIDIKGQLILSNTLSKEETISNIKTKITEYLSQNNFNKTELSYARILNIALSSDGVDDILNFKINDDYVNVVCDETEIFVLNSFELEV